MEQLTDKELIINNTVFCAYFCYLIESDQADAVKDLCEIGLRFENEINKRKISESNIAKCILRAALSPQEQVMVASYIYPDSDYYNTKIGKS